MSNNFHQLYLPTLKPFIKSWWGIMSQSVRYNTKVLLVQNFFKAIDNMPVIKHATVYIEKAIRLLIFFKSILFYKKYALFTKLFNTAFITKNSLKLINNISSIHT